MLDEVKNLSELFSERLLYSLSSVMKRRVCECVNSCDDHTTAKFLMNAIFGCLFIALSARMLHGLRLFG
jgi:hypothetical protein